MLNPQWQERLAVPMRTLQIIVGAMAVGCFAFMAVAIFIVGSSGPISRPADVPLMSYLALAMIPVFILARIVVILAVTSSGCGTIAQGGSSSPDRPPEGDGDDDLAALARLYTSRTIIGAALFEGISFFLLIAFLLEGLPMVAGAAMATIVCIMLHFPTSSRVAGWIESKSQLVDQQRQFLQKP